MFINSRTNIFKIYYHTYRADLIRPDGPYTVKKSFGFTGYCGFFRFWDQKSPSMDVEIFYTSYKVSFLIGEKENQFRL
jgi:hypothetical protein